MSNPWEPIITKPAIGIDWLVEKGGPAREVVNCPSCQSTNCIEVWIDGGTSTYVCAECDCEFSVEGSARAGVIRDIPLSSDGRAYASVWFDDVWSVSFNFIDECVVVRSFEAEDEVLNNIDLLKLYLVGVKAGAVYEDVSTGNRIMVCLEHDGIAYLDNDTECSALRIAIGVLEGAFQKVLDN